LWISEIEGLRLDRVHRDSMAELLEELKMVDCCMYVHTCLYGKLHTNNRKLSQTTPRINGPLIQK